MNKKGNSRIIGAGIALVVLMVIAQIVSAVENGTVWVQTISGTIGDYIEPIALLSGLALAGGMAAKAVRGR